MNACRAINASSFLKNNLKGYKCQKMLGEGSFGRTFLMKKGDRKVVVKSIFKKYVNDIEVMKEAYILKKLQQQCSLEHVLCHFNSIKSQSEVYIITEYIEGCDMFDYYRSKYRLDTLKTNTFKFIGQMIEGLRYIHKLGVVHFDIKPENVMVTEEGSLKIIDFGGAVYSKNKGKISQITYTSPYLPPGAEDHMKNIPYSHGVYRDFYAFFKTFRNDTSGVISPLDKVMDVDPGYRLNLVYKLFDKVEKYNYKLKITLIKQLL
jgi:serine/threonine protein kinase